MYDIPNAHMLSSTRDDVMRMDSETETFVDLRHLEADAQTNFLLEETKKDKERQVTRNDIYLLQGQTSTTLNKLISLNTGLHDIDGTHTTVGGHRMFERNIRGLQALEDQGVTNVAVTGRHLWQVEELIANHRDQLGISRWLVEQGFYERTGSGQVEYFQGSPDIEHCVTGVREQMMDILRMLEEEHGIHFETTSASGEHRKPYPHAHRTMYSVDAERDGLKIGDNDKELHQMIFQALGRQWQLRDPDAQTAKLRTSSIGTYEWSPKGLSKQNAVEAMMRELGTTEQKTMYMGDSGNDIVVFESFPEISRVAVMNTHTDVSLIRHADIATIGTGNAGPVLDLVAREKAKARKIRV